MHTRGLRNGVTKARGPRGTLEFTGIFKMKVGEEGKQEYNSPGGPKETAGLQPQWWWDAVG